MGIVEGVYEPSARVQALPACVHQPAHPKQIQCRSCKYVVTSAWFFVHPATATKFVLVPQMGHTACSRLPILLGKKRGHVACEHCPFATVDGSPCKKTLFSNLDYC